MISKSSLIALVAGALVMLVLPSSAAAQRCPGAVPPGNPQVDQYVETFPGDCGDRQVNPTGGGSGGDAGGSAGSTVPSSTAAQLQSLGPEGEQAARVAELTAPGGAGGGGDQGGGGAGGGAGEGDGAFAQQGSLAEGGFSLGSFLAGLLRVLGGDAEGGLGLALPILFGLVALLSVGYLLRRRIFP